MHEDDHAARLRRHEQRGRDLLVVVTDGETLLRAGNGVLSARISVLLRARGVLSAGKRAAFWACGSPLPEAPRPGAGVDCCWSGPCQQSHDLLVLGLREVAVPCTYAAETLGLLEDDDLV